MDLQVHIGYDLEPLCERNFRPVSNDPKGKDDPTHRHKPSRRLWTSTYTYDTYFSAYGRNWKLAVGRIAEAGLVKEYKEDAWHAAYLKVWKLRPSPSIRVAVIDCCQHLDALKLKHCTHVTRFAVTEEEARRTDADTVGVRGLDFAGPFWPNFPRRWLNEARAHMGVRRLPFPMVGRIFYRA
jgi:hypothetical protein